MPERGPTMRAAVLRDIDSKLDLDEYPRPEPGPGEALVRIRAAGVCHTDLHLVAGVPDDPPLPLVLGHEITGEVVRLGRETATPARTGDRVLVYYYNGCRSCDWCTRGLENLCRKPNAKWGFDTDGGYAEYISVPVRCLVPLPAGVGYAEGAVLGCSGTTATHVIDTVARVASGELVVVLGAGGVGLATIQVALARGATVIAVDPDPGSRAAAITCGASAATTPTALPDEVHSAVGGRCADVVVDTVGDAGTPGLAIDVVRPQGRVVLVGYTSALATLAVTDVVTREVMVRGSVGSTLADAAEVVRMAEEGSLRAFIAGEYPLERVNDALDRLRAGRVVGRLVLTP